MRRKINRKLIGIAVFSIVMTMLAMTVIFYSRLKTQVFSDLKIMAELLSHEKGDWKSPENIRITLIDRDGAVLYDSAADAMTMGNHLDRPEVEAAFRSGFGQAARMSDTMSVSTFYYAMRLEDGRILRVGREAASVVWLFLSAVPVVAVMMFVLTAVCMMVSRYLTAALIAPIDKLVEHMDQNDENEIYEELVPFTRKIRSQHEEILSAANIRQEFTANVTHELKTPLAAISGYAQLMESGVAKEADISHFSHEITKCASRLLALINDIIKLSRLDAGNCEEALEIVDLAAIARDTVETLSITAAKMNVSISYKGASRANVRIGREMAEELAYNLIENAIRYNKPNGRVDVKVAENVRAVTFMVSDTGIGIPEEHQKRIFERFYRVDKSRSKELGGTGLGLAIVKHICTLTRGELRLDSQEGQGTSVTITWNHDLGRAG